MVFPEKKVLSPWKPTKKRILNTVLNIYLHKSIIFFNYAPAILPNFILIGIIEGFSKTTE
jgi:hypothetical protein